MIDVLTDLQTFAERNGLPDLAEKLAETAHIAAADVKVKPTLSPCLTGARAQYDGIGTRTILGAGGKGLGT